MLFGAISGVLSLIILIAAGYILLDRPWFGDGGAALLTNFTAKITIPCYLFVTIYTVCGTRERLLQAARRVPVPISVMLFMMALAFILAKLLKIENKRRGVFINAVTFCNTVLIGMPVIEAVFGQSALNEALVYYMANTLLFWTIGILLLRPGGENRGGLDTVRASLRGLLSPNLLCALAAALCLLLDIHIPEFLLSPISFVGRCTTGLAMLCTGCILRRANIKSLLFSRDMLIILLARFIVSPAIMLALCLILPISNLFAQVLMVYSFMPAMTQLGILSRVHDSDYPFASVVVSGTTVMTMGAVPIFVAIMNITGLFGG